MTELRQREPRQVDQKHIDFVNKLPCCCCGSTRNVEAAHIRLACPAIGKRETGMGERPDDRFVTPLCRYHHQTGAMAQHRVGEKVFWAMHGRNPFQIAAALWIESGGAARSQDPKPAKRPRKTKPRDLNAPKRQIPGRALQSRSTFPPGRKLQSRNTFERRP